MEDIEDLDSLLRQSERNLDSEPKYSLEDIAWIHERLEFFESVVEAVLVEMESLPGNTKKRAENKRLLKEDQEKLCGMVRFCVRFSWPMGPEINRIEEIERFLLQIYPDARPFCTRHLAYPQPYDGLRQRPPKAPVEPQG